MTTAQRIGSEKKKLREMTPGQFCFGLFSVFCLFLILRNSDTAIGYMNRGLRLCAKTVIPSLFPFMVLSELIVSGGIGRVLLKKVCAPFSRLFRIPDAGCCAVLLGMLCGFPIGAKCAVLALDDGRLTRDETERVLTFSNNPSSAFLINAVGVSLWENRRFGVALYAVILFCAVVTGLLFAHLPRKKAEPPTDVPEPRNTRTFKKGTVLFTDAIRSATSSMLTVCAYVIFFSALIGTLNDTLSVIAVPEFVRSLIFCLFELSGGMSAASSLPDPRTAALLCAFGAGWSGLSVHCQILSVCDGHGLKFRRYFLAKLFQGLLGALLFGAVLAVFPDLLIPAQKADAVFRTTSGTLPFLTVAFLACLLFTVIGRRKKRHHHPET